MFKPLSNVQQTVLCCTSGNAISSMFMRVVAHVALPKGVRSVLSEEEVLQRAFLALDELVGKPVADMTTEGISPEGWPESLRELADERAATSAEPETARREVWLSWVEWRAMALNRLFQEQGVTGQPGKITAATVEHGERGRHANNQGTVRKE